jgi:hypothetical protein
MPKLVFTHIDGKCRFAKLVSTSNSQRPNETQLRQLEQVNRRLPPEILAELSTRGLVIPARELDVVLAQLKTADDLSISIGD